MGVGPGSGARNERGGIAVGVDGLVSGYLSISHSWFRQIPGPFFAGGVRCIRLRAKQRKLYDLRGSTVLNPGSFTAL